MVEVKCRRVVDVLRILPIRHQADENGHLDASSAMRSAQKRADLLWIERVKLGFGWAYGGPGSAALQARIEQVAERIAEHVAKALTWPTRRCFDLVSLVEFRPGT